MTDTCQRLRSRLRRLILAGGLALSSAAVAQGPQAQAPKSPADWDKFCRITTAVEKELANAKDPAERATKWAAAVVAGAPWGKGFTNSFTAVAVMDPAWKYRALQQGAKEEGVAGWDCPAVRRLLDPFAGVVHEHPCAEPGADGRRGYVRVQLAPPMSLADVHLTGDSGSGWQGHLGYSTTPAGDSVFDEKARHRSAVYCLDVAPGDYLFTYYSDKIPPDRYEQRFSVKPGQSLELDARQPAGNKPLEK